MTQNICLLSDTHGYMDRRILHYAKQSDQVWHAGDVGDLSVLDELEAVAKVRCVFGNIDGDAIRAKCPEKMNFNCENQAVYMTHIGGYPPKYTPTLRKVLVETKPKIFVCGHSHILKVMYDKSLDILHLNPGAAGRKGFHKVRTLLRFKINQTRIFDLEVVELEQIRR